MATQSKAAQQIASGAAEAPKVVFIGNQCFGRIKSMECQREQIEDPSEKNAEAASPGGSAIPLTFGESSTTQAGKGLSDPGFAQLSQRASDKPHDYVAHGVDASTLRVVTEFNGVSGQWASLTTEQQSRYYVDLNERAELMAQDAHATPAQRGTIDAAARTVGDLARQSGLVPPNALLPVDNRQGQNVSLGVMMAGRLPVGSAGARGIEALSARMQQFLNWRSSQVPELPVHKQRGVIRAGAGGGTLVKAKTVKERARALEAADRGHSLDRHGPEVSDAKLQTRLQTGVAPDNVFSPTKASTRFSNYDEWEKTRTDALQAIEKRDGIDLSMPPVAGQLPPKRITMDHGRPIDEGYVGDPSTRVKVANPSDPTDVRWGYPNSTPVSGITRTTTAVRWNPTSQRWEVRQHFPDADGWNQATQSYGPP